jgi:hypothetical protein
MIFLKQVLCWEVPALSVIDSFPLQPICPGSGEEKLQTSKAKQGVFREGVTRGSMI